jgi:hypothetical protein
MDARGVVGCFEMMKLKKWNEEWTMNVPAECISVYEAQEKYEAHLVEGKSR